MNIIQGIKIYNDKNRIKLSFTKNKINQTCGFKWTLVGGEKLETEKWMKEMIDFKVKKERCAARIWPLWGRAIQISCKHASMQPRTKPNIIYYILLDFLLKM